MGFTALRFARSGRATIATIATALLAAWVVTGGARPLHAQSDAESRQRNQPVAPYRILGNLYYVGASDVTSFLIATPAGLIVLDGGYLETAPQIRANIATLGFALRDVKVLLSSHAHADHAGGLEQLRQWTGAWMLASDLDAPLLAAGGRGDFLFGDTLPYPPVRVDGRVSDGMQVTLGGSTLVAHLTPGHTRGCTTWTMQVQDAGKTYDVVFYGSTSVLTGYRLTDRPSYPGIAADYAHTFQVLKSLPCDVFLGAHASFYDGLDKARRLRAGAQPNPFIDPQGYRDFVAAGEAAYRKQLAAEAQPAAPDAAANPAPKPSGNRR
jgi:metallo-beta-lactamase class B